MLNYRTLAVIKRELREKLMSKSFIISTILLPLFMFGILGFQTLLFSYGGGNKVTLHVITESPDLTAKLEAELSNIESVKEGNYIMSYYTMTKPEFDKYLKDKKESIVKEEISGLIFVSEAAMTDKKIQYYSKTPKDISLSDKLSGPINKVLIDNYFTSKNLSPADLDFARTGVDFTSFKVTENEKIEEEGYGNLILSYLFSFILYISLLMMGQMIMQSVLEEKNNRIVEVLLSSVHPNELMTGKVLGMGITGGIQMAIWLTPVILVISTSWFMLPPEFVFSITLLQVAYLLVNYVVGLITFLGLFATVGAIFDNAQEAQSGMWPLMMLIIIPFFIAMSMVRNPNNTIAEIASIAPFASIIVMPAKLAIVDVPMWQLIGSFVINVATIFAIFPIAGKIYRVGILRTGKKPKWSEIFAWLKYKY
jgi:ABC-2 type transport system permease protein